MDKPRSNNYLKITILSAFLVILGSVIFIISLLKQPETTPATPAANSNPIPAANAQTPSQQPKTVDVLSPDGKFSLTMKVKSDQNSNIYTFSVTDTSSGLSKELFTKTTTSGDVLSPPLNAFSPNDKYFFLKEVDNGVADYYVLSASGISFSNGSQTLDISSPFVVKYSANYVITDVTGWAAPTLVVINTNKVDGSLGPSFWFDVSTKSFIPLATRFN